MNENCKFAGKRSCTILKQLYCKKEPNKQCSFYKQKDKEECTDERTPKNN